MARDVAVTQQITHALPLMQLSLCFHFSATKFPVQLVLLLAENIHVQQDFFQ